MSGTLRKIAWVLIFLGAASFVFLAWHQSIMLSESRRFGIEVPWLGSLLWFFAFAALEAVAIYAALRRYYGLSIAFGGFVAALLGLVSLGVIAGVGM